MQEEQSYHIPILDSVGGVSVPAEPHKKDALKDNSNNVSMTTNDPETAIEVIDGLNSSKSDGIDENKDDYQSTKPAALIEFSNGVTSSSDNSTEQVNLSSLQLQSPAINVC